MTFCQITNSAFPLSNQTEELFSCSHILAESCIQTIKFLRQEKKLSQSATTAKCLQLKDFVKEVAIWSSLLKCQMQGLNFPGTEFVGTEHKFSKKKEIFDVFRGTSYKGISRIILQSCSYGRDVVLLILLLFGRRSHVAVVAFVVTFYLVILKLLSNHPQLYTSYVLKRKLQLIILSVLHQ